MRRKKERSKQGQTNKQGKATQHTQGSHFSYMYMTLADVNSTCSHIPVYCVYQSTHTLLPSPPLLSSSQEQRSIPLGIAAQKGHLDTVKRLVEGGSNIDHQNKVRTLEHVSCDQVYGNVEMLTS